MFKAAGKTRALVTLFHTPTSAVSKNLVSLIKTKYENPAVRNFDIEIVEDKPTREQIKTLSNYIKEEELTRPVLVDWFNGKVAVNNEQKSVDILNELLKNQT